VVRLAFNGLAVLSLVVCEAVVLIWLWDAATLDPSLPNAPPRYSLGFEVAAAGSAGPFDPENTRLPYALCVVSSALPVALWLRLRPKLAAHSHDGSSRRQVQMR
jgi:hypothetical protein